MSKENSGTLKIINGFTLVWTRCADGEICGHVEYPQGGIVSKSGGYWRTEDQHLAALKARDAIFNPDGELRPAYSGESDNG